MKKADLPEVRRLAVYVHIPFCVRKCLYCDFLSFAGEDRKNEYFDALKREIAAAAGSFDRSSTAVSSLYIGGGTPTTADAGQICGVMDAIRGGFGVEAGAEISIECNPGTADREKLKALRKAGINRLSIGVQSFSDKELGVLGRIHSAEQARRCFCDAREAGFDNINLDIMAALPGQDAEGLLETLREAAALAPEHISLYSLIIEPGTPFFQMYRDEVPDPHFDRPVRKKGGSMLPDEDEERRMMHLAWEFLDSAGYRRYEISNFSGTDPGGRDLRCAHNLVYWRRGEYLGLGLGAASLLDETRFSNTSELNEYISGGEGSYPASMRLGEKLDQDGRMEEFMFLGLRLTEGVSEQTFSDTFGTDIDVVYGAELKKLKEKGLIAREGGRIFLTERGTDLANYVMAEFIR